MTQAAETSLSDLIVYALLGFGVYMFLTRPAGAGAGVTVIPTNEPLNLPIDPSMIQPIQFPSVDATIQSGSPGVITSMPDWVSRAAIMN